jgi:predicted Zn-dependent peptidase
VYVGTATETASKAVDAIREELRLLAADGLSDDDIIAGKSQLKGQITLALESASARMYRAAGVELYDEEYRSLDEVLALIDSIDRDSVASVCAEFFAPDSQTILSLGPGGMPIAA